MNPYTEAYKDPIFKIGIIFAVLLVLLVLANSVFANPLPGKEIKVINQVADEYNLVGEERTLLFVIRIIENGDVGREFGVLNPQAMRFKDDPDMSFRTQARWAAGTIKKRFNDNLEGFANRWAPIGAKNDPDNLNKNWFPNAQHWMKKLGVE